MVVCLIWYKEDFVHAREFGGLGGERFGIAAGKKGGDIAGTEFRGGREGGQGAGEKSLVFVLEDGEGGEIGVRVTSV